ncbi:MAG TPA: acetate--CoA ligase family protein [Vicinamibacterales bacterium]|nr:acetate--CoA ligase family protein [Vicinamibacterales bacterium]
MSTVELAGLPASMTSFFAPRAVAVIGASRDPRHIGSAVLHNLQACGFHGQLVAVHPSEEFLHGVPAYPRATAIPHDVDLAIVSVPAAAVEAVIDDCLVKGIHAICVISAGFGEIGEEGRAREQAIVGKVRAAGGRLIGPNCMGLLNTDPAISLNATFAPAYPPAGSIALSSQSGALGVAILDYAKQLNIGISTFVSVGNKADVSGNDLLEYWESDPQTNVILLYLESFGNPAKFSRLARRISRTKPIIALKSGRSTAGALAAASHTGALAASDDFVDALFHQSGVIRTETITELFDVATLLSQQPLPAGRRVAILTNAGGPGILAADACQAHGLAVATLSASTEAGLRAFLPAAAGLHDPVDMLASATPEQYGRALALLLDDPGVDCAIAIFIPPLVTDPDAVAAAIADAAAARQGKPVCGVFMRSQAAPAALAGIPCFTFPEPAAIALSKVAEYGEWRARPPGEPAQLEDLQPVLARGVVDGALRRGGGWLTSIEANALLAAVGIPTPRSYCVHSVDEAARAATRLGFPVVVKAVGAQLLHKTEHRAVRLHLATERAVRSAAEELLQSLGERVECLLVQRMVDGGTEMMIGAIDDPIFGHAIVCGSGGVLVDLLADSACRLHPLTRQDADLMVSGLKGVRLLRGYRGAAAANEAAFRDAILRISALVEQCPEIRELDVNPLKVLADGVSAVDVRIRVSATPAPAGRRAR